MSPLLLLPHFTVLDEHVFELLVMSIIFRLSYVAIS